MILKKINLINFRNYSNLELNFNKKINIFIGNNAQGKTNILEAMYVLSVTKSHRCNKDLFLIKNDNLFTKITGTVENDSISKKYEVLINSEGKRVSISGKKIKKISDYISNINMIIFCPDDLEIIKGTPSIRRTFLNIEIGQFYNLYIKELNEYNKLLKQRNEHLKSGHFNKLYFDVLTEKLIEKNIIIYEYRKDFIDKINNYIVDIYKSITKKNKINVVYDTFIEGTTKEEIYNNVKEKYDKVYESELYQKMTLVGIHRDDFSIYIDNIKINNYGSQGQHRIAILCFKLAEIEIYKEKNIKPIILLDDIFSELDIRKKASIIKYINNDLQIFITTTDLNNLNKRLISNAEIFKVSKGKITRGEQNE